MFDEYLLKTDKENANTESASLFNAVETSKGMLQNERQVAREEVI